jgi:hypothetical protein
MQLATTGAPRNGTHLKALELARLQKAGHEVIIDLYAVLHVETAQLGQPSDQLLQAFGRHLCQTCPPPFHVRTLAFLILQLGQTPAWKKASMPTRSLLRATHLY